MHHMMYNMTSFLGANVLGCEVDVIQPCPKSPRVNYSITNFVSSSEGRGRSRNMIRGVPQLSYVCGGHTHFTSPAH